MDINVRLTLEMPRTRIYTITMMASRPGSLLGSYWKLYASQRVDSDGKWTGSS